jgi:hypothetical protein
MDVPFMAVDQASAINRVWSASQLLFLTFWLDNMASNPAQNRADVFNV